MESASSNAYVSKRVLEEYAKQRASLQQQKKNPIPQKQFQEDEEVKEVVNEQQELIDTLKDTNNDVQLQSESLQEASTSFKSSAKPIAEKKSSGFSLFSFLSGGKKSAAPKIQKDELFEIEKAERNNSCAEIDSDDLEGELNLSDDGSKVRGEIKARRQKKKRKANVYHQEVDTNIFKMDFKCLKQGVELATGDPTICEKCQAVFSNKSKLTKQINGDQVWQCEFCNFENKVFLDEEEIPKTNTVNYIVEAAAQVADKKAEELNQEISVVFCLDISGSMCVSKAVEGKHQIKGDRISSMQGLQRQFGDGSDQFLQSEKNQTYISRIQCVQAAIDSQISSMKKSAAKRKIGVVTFNHEVTILGDGTKVPQTITGDKLNDFEYLLKNGQDSSKTHMDVPIGESAEMLHQKLMQIDETGPTALGPGILSAIGIASEGSKGSQVIICTDGLANVGLGAFDEAHNESDLAKVEEFYERVAQIAKEKGVSVTIISIEGDECNLDSLSKLAEMTGGDVERVDPVTLKDDFANILAVPIIASNVVAKVKLHNGMAFRNEQAANLSEDQTLLVRQFGNVTEDTEYTFEYTLKSIADLLKMEDFDLTQIKELPFQAQISYTSMDGAKMLRIITQSKEISSNRQELEKKANLNIMGTNAIQQSSKMARAGNMKQAQVIAKVWDRKMKTNLESEQQIQDYKQSAQARGQIYDMINCERQYSDEGSDCEQEMMDCMPQARMISKANAQQPRAKNMGKQSDSLSMNLYKAQKKKF